VAAETFGISGKEALLNFVIREALAKKGLKFENQIRHVLLLDERKDRRT
jgi:hypothetical protein